MKNLTKFAVFAALCGAFVACDDSGASASDETINKSEQVTESSSSEVILSSSQNQQSNSSGSEQPESIKNVSNILDYECNDARQCAKLYAEDVDDTLQCVNGEWGSYIASIKNECSDVSSSSLENENLSSSDNDYESSSSSKKLSSSSSDESGEVQESESSSSEKLSSSSSEVMLSSSQNEQSSSSVDTESPQGDVSSSSEESSSSFTGIDPSAVIKGTMTDERDGKVYKTVTIGEQTWMAENLNYAYNGKTSSLDSSSFCYNDEPDSCVKYGRLYLWSAAMDSAAVFSDDGEGCGYNGICSASGYIRGVCPEGWHLPDSTEWLTLFTAVGGIDSAGTKLKSTSGNGEDSYGFSALPAGYRDYSGSFYIAGYHAHFWSSIEYDSSYAYGRYFYNNYASVYEGNYRKYLAFSVRCVRY